MMRAFLIRIGVDHACGGWNAPMDRVSNKFVYVPIPESRPMRPPLATPYSLVEPALARFADRHPKAPRRSVHLPAGLTAVKMHLDPDFGHLTYGDGGRRRGKPLLGLGSADVVAF